MLIEFSSLTSDVQRRLEDKLDRFTATFERAPTPRERWRLEREAVLDSRPAKAHQYDAVALHDGWRAQAVRLGDDPAAIVNNASATAAALDAPGRERSLVRGG